MVCPPSISEASAPFPLFRAKSSVAGRAAPVSTPTAAATAATATTAATDPKGLIWKENLQTHMKISCMQWS
jgi:hypothetical protein